MSTNNLVDLAAPLNIPQSIAIGKVGSSGPSLVEYKDYRFVIFDSPTDANIANHIQELKKYDVDTIVRACEPTYSTAPFKQAGLEDIPFVDGEPPPDHVINSWLQLVERHTAHDKSKAIGIHCIAGLGRAPVLVAIAIIETGMPAYDVIEYIRKRRKYAINHRQMGFLEKYRVQSSQSDCCCLS